MELGGAHAEERRLAADLGEAMARYAPDKMKEGWNTMPDGEEVFFISTPSAGLWSTEAKLANRR